MEALPDTHAFLWWLADSSRLSTTAHSVIADDANRPFVSAASAFGDCAHATRSRTLAPMALNPVAYTENVVKSFLRYQLTAYPFADPRRR